jgi:hypothetical protein
VGNLLRKLGITRANAWVDLPCAATDCCRRQRNDGGGGANLFFPCDDPTDRHSNPTQWSALAQAPR